MARSVDELREERRKYLRLDSAFPVEFRLLTLDGQGIFSGWLQGFTSNIGDGGICLSVNNLDPELAKLLREGQSKLSIAMELPVSKSPIKATAKVSWIKEILGEPNKTLIGLNYERIIPGENRRIMRYAHFKKSFLPVIISITLLLVAALSVNSFISLKLIKGNKSLVNQLIKIAQDSSIAKQKIKEINKEREDLLLKIQALQERIRSSEEERSSQKDQEKIIKELRVEKDALQEELIAIQLRENFVTEELLRLDKRKSILEKANFDKMYQWLRVRQNPRTGLVTSGTEDRKIKDWAYTYDQALAAQAYIYFADFERARKIFDFFKLKAKRENARFYQAYSVLTGLPAQTKVENSDNIWLAIAIMHYTERAQDKSYLDLAEEMAQVMIKIPADSMKERLEAYAFFNMLYKITGKEEYLKEAQLILDRLTQNPAALNSSTWSIAALGAQKLDELGISPERILESIEQEKSLEVIYMRSEGQTLKVKGFTDLENIPGEQAFISSEYSAEMIITYKIVADYFDKKGLVAKSRTYALKADDYLSSLISTIIPSTSSGMGEACIPAEVTKEGKGLASISGTAFTIFAYYNYNPFALSN